MRVRGVVIDLGSERDLSNLTHRHFSTSHPQSVIIHYYYSSLIFFYNHLKSTPMTCFHPCFIDLNPND